MATRHFFAQVVTWREAPLAAERCDGRWTMETTSELVMERAACGGARAVPERCPSGGGGRLDNLKNAVREKASTQRFRFQEDKTRR